MYMSNLSSIKIIADQIQLTQTQYCFDIDFTNQSIIIKTVDEFPYFTDYIDQQVLACSISSTNTEQTLPLRFQIEKQLLEVLNLRSKPIHTVFEVDCFYFHTKQVAHLSKSTKHCYSPRQLQYFSLTFRFHCLWCGCHWHIGQSMPAFDARFAHSQSFIALEQLFAH